ETVLDQHTGLVVDGTSDREIVEAVAGLLTDRPRASAMGVRGRNWVLDRWRWEDLARGMEQVLSGEEVRAGRTEPAGPVRARTTPAPPVSGVEVVDLGGELLVPDVPLVLERGRELLGLLGELVG